jgi:hypothetical protein
VVRVNSFAIQSAGTKSAHSTLLFEDSEDRFDDPSRDILIDCRQHNCGSRLVIPSAVESLP